MKPTHGEEVIHRFVLSGEFQIDAGGQVWRLGASDGHSVEPVTRRRAENKCGGYLHVRRMVNGKRVSCQAHRLVWRHFNSRPIGDLTINHINGNKRDNRPENLELATYSEQAKHAHRVLNVGGGFRSGSLHPRAKLNESQVIEIRRRRADGQSLNEIAAQFGVGFSAISSVVRRRNWTHVEDGR